jgi:hypothetical protein
MPLYEMTPDDFRPISQASFADLKVRERDDLQRLLRTQIDVLGDDLSEMGPLIFDWYFFTSAVVHRQRSVPK